MLDAKNLGLILCALALISGCDRTVDADETPSATAFVTASPSEEPSPTQVDGSGDDDRDPDPNGPIFHTPLPEIAESIEVLDADRTIVSLLLRSDLTTERGERFTTAAVISELQEALSGFGGQPPVRNLVSAEDIDELTINFTFDRPSAGVPDDLRIWLGTFTFEVIEPAGDG